MAKKESEAVELGREVVGEYVVKRIDQLQLKLGFLGLVMSEYPDNKKVIQQLFVQAQRVTIEMDSYLDW